MAIKIPQMLTPGGNFPIVVLALLILSSGMRAQSGDSPSQSGTVQAQGQRAGSPAKSPDAATKTDWHYGGFADLAYLWDFNDPPNHLFRDRGTAFRVNEVDLNMAGLYLRRDASEHTRWAMEFTLQAGKDSEAFGFSATAPNIGEAKWLRHFGPTDVSYLAPLGKGLTIQAGLFSSLIGYDSLYAKDNFNYTRPWGADYTPYLMFGVNMSYPLTEKLTGTLFVINGYWHLAHANNVPSSGGQLAYKLSRRTTLKETLLYGPHQADTNIEFWRFFSDTIAEWKGNRVTAAFEYQVGTEKVAILGEPRALWTAAQLPVHWNLHGPWSVTFRPEFAWDRDGRWTGSEQLIKAITTTFEYRFPYRSTNTILRLEHRYDNSTGKGGGFFTENEMRPGAIGLTPSQHLLILAVIFTFDSSF